MKKPGQPPNWGWQQQQRMQQQRRRAAGYAWQKQKREQELQAERLRAQQQAGQLDQGLDLGGVNRYASMPAVEPRPRRSCLGTAVRIVGILLAIGACLFIAAIILGNI